jgi:hypothetical protein
MIDLALTVTETDRLHDLEIIIERGLETFIEVGNALLEIRDQRLYRLEHKTFEQYCRQRWNMSRRQGDRVIQAAEVTRNLRPIGLTPDNEAQVRPLVGLEPEAQTTVWELAVENACDGKVTAEQVTAIKDHLMEEVRDHEERGDPFTMDHFKESFRSSVRHVLPPPRRESREKHDLSYASFSASIRGICDLEHKMDFLVQEHLELPSLSEEMLSRCREAIRIIEHFIQTVEENKE